ncbi:MAG: NUDIX domain-containing protein [Desulfobacterales bacterium]|jgi:predicted NUDIX family NTP pyrophosphohydrolase
MARKSAGLLMYRFRGKRLEVFLVHPGGPFWAKKDTGSWSVPKGEYSAGEEIPLDVAKREFKEETGYEAHGVFTPLTPIKQPSRKIITAWAFEGDCEASKIKSNTFKMQWPPKTGKEMEFPEVDRAGWFTIDRAEKKLLRGQVGFIEELCRILNYT